MNETMKYLGALTLGVVLSLLLGVTQLHAQSSEPPTMLTGEHFEPGAALGDPDCDPPAGAPRLELQPPKATAASIGSGTFYLCFDAFCGECPSGTHCAIEACGSLSAPHCTFAFACVGSCFVANCSFLAPDCREF